MLAPLRTVEGGNAYKCMGTYSEGPRFRFVSTRRRVSSSKATTQDHSVTISSSTLSSSKSVVVDGLETLGDVAAAEHQRLLQEGTVGPHRAPTPCYAPIISESVPPPMISQELLGVRSGGMHPSTPAVPDASVSSQGGLTSGMIRVSELLNPCGEELEASTEQT